MVIAALLGIALVGCSSRVAIRVTNETEVAYLVALRGELRGVWEAPPNSAGDIVIPLAGTSTLLLVMTETCEITQRHGYSDGTYELTILEAGHADSLKHDVALTGRSLLPTDACS
jgi:hypothetical protein